MMVLDKKRLELYRLFSIKNKIKIPEISGNNFQELINDGKIYLIETKDSTNITFMVFRKYTVVNPKPICCLNFEWNCIYYSRFESDYCKWIEVNEVTGGIFMILIGRTIKKLRTWVRLILKESNTAYIQMK